MISEEDLLGRLLLLGENYPDYGALASTRVGSRAAAAISVGSDTSSPSLQFKAESAVPNEDALCVMEAGDWAGYAVADAHFGSESSHVLLTRLHGIWSRIKPTGLRHLAQMIEFLRDGEPPVTESESTLLVVFYDRIERSGYGVSFGDSSFVIVGESSPATPVNARDDRFVNTAGRSLLNANVFRFTTEPGDVLLVYTDGVDQCHYRHPETSVRPQHVTSIVREAGGDPLAIVDQLAALALRGVGGNPGGQDNIAIIAAQS